MSLFTVQRRLRLIRRVLVPVVVLAWLALVVWDSVLRQASSGTWHAGLAHVEGIERIVVVGWRRAGLHSSPAWMDVSIELALEGTRSLPGPGPMNDVAIERADRFTYVFRRPDGTTYGPATLDFGSEVIRVRAELHGIGIPIRERAPGIEWSISGVLWSLSFAALKFSAVGIGALVLVLLLAHTGMWWKEEKWECPSCGYDIHESVEGCPECGWGRETANS